MASRKQPTPGKHRGARPEFDRLVSKLGVPEPERPAYVGFCVQLYRQALEAGVTGMFRVRQAVERVWTGRGLDVRVLRKLEGPVLAWATGPNPEAGHG